MGRVLPQTAHVSIRRWTIAEPYSTDRRPSRCDVFQTATNGRFTTRGRGSLLIFALPWGGFVAAARLDHAVGFDYD
jgi:hypothetical protein